MLVATWNVNSLNVRLPHLLQWLQMRKPDVVALQETKLPDERFPVAEIEEAGYVAAYAGQKTYNGVALLSRTPPEEVAFDVPGLEDPDRRILAATVEGVRIYNLYVVNGQSVDSPKYAYKLQWLEKVARHLGRELERHPELLVMGDFNIAPEDRDVHDPEKWREQVLASTPEREALRRILDLGLVDVFRLFDQPEGTFSWWDYRAAAFRRNAGLRIDLILASTPLARRCTECWIDIEPRRWERPSDHAPVLARFAPPSEEGAGGAGARE